ncbi:Calsenilin [Halotydeus destructor]|nr:Calsenilin [Halotydeus destructor]
MSIVEDFLDDARPVYAPRESLESLIRCTKFTKREIKLMYRNFKEDCPTGFVDADTLRDVLQRFFPYGNSGPYAQYIFRTLDPKKNGEVTFKEFLIWLSEVSRGNIQDKLRAIFRLYDLNGDGIISRKELSLIITSIYLMLGKKRNTVDDKYIAEKTERFFERFDLDGDGHISLEEFVSICSIDTLIVKSLAHFNTVI